MSNFMVVGLDTAFEIHGIANEQARGPPPVPPSWLTILLESCTL
jgi:hypothetical protein